MYDIRPDVINPANFIGISSVIVGIDVLLLSNSFTDKYLLVINNITEIRKKKTSAILPIYSGYNSVRYSEIDT